MNRRDMPTLICFAGCDWWFHNRGLFCPQVMTRLAKRYRILFINSLPTSFPSVTQDRHAFKKMMRKFKSMARYLRKSDGMYIFSPLSVPIFGNVVGQKLNALSVFLQVKLMTVILGLRKPIFYIGCPPALEVVRWFERRFLIYERTDLFEEAPGASKSYIASLDEELTKSADLVLYVNTALWKEGSPKNSNSLLLGHGLDVERFVRAEESDHVPEDMATIPSPIIGYYGAIDDKVCDLELLEHIAKTLPDISLVLIGPRSCDVSSLKSYGNVFFLGHKPYEDIHHYGKVFDVAIMPWKINKWIEFCNPVITKEYLALGKPIVSVDYPELKPYEDIVYSASTPDEFVEMIRKALDEKDLTLKVRRQAKVEGETWDSKVAQIEEAIEKCMSNPLSAQ